MGYDKNLTSAVPKPEEKHKLASTTVQDNNKVAKNISFDDSHPKENKTSENFSSATSALKQQEYSNNSSVGSQLKENTTNHSSILQPGEIEETQHSNFSIISEEKNKTKELGEEKKIGNVSTLADKLKITDKAINVTTPVTNATEKPKEANGSKGVSSVLDPSIITKEIAGGELKSESKI